MVPLLIVMMTGMVIGQQQDSSRTGNFDPIGRPSADNSKLAPFELSVSDQDLMGIRQKGSVLRSRIAPKDPSTGQALPLDVISGISLVHQDNLNRDLPMRKIMGHDAGNGVIRFGLDDFDLMKLQNNTKLGFDFDYQTRGKFNLVEFYYESKDPDLNSGPTPDDNMSSRASFGRGNSHPAFGQPRTTPLPLLPPPGPESLPGGIAFEGPVMPSRNNGFSPTQTTGIAQNQNSSGWGPEDRLQTNPTFNFPSQNSSANGWKIPNQNRSDNPTTNNWPDPSQSSLGDSTSNRFAPLLTYEQKVAKRRAELELQNKNQQFQTFLAAQQQALVEKEAELKKRQQDLDYQRYVDELRSQSSQNNHLPNGVVSGTDFRAKAPGIEVPERFASTDPNLVDRGYIPRYPPTDRLANQTNPNPNRGIKDLAMQVPGVNNRIGNSPLDEQNKRTEHFIYFMLLCSLGLNVYLAWISRGFYVRYNELADELRDTFTATM